MSVFAKNSGLIVFSVLAIFFSFSAFGQGYQDLNGNCYPDIFEPVRPACPRIFLASTKGPGNPNSGGINPGRCFVGQNARVKIVVSGSFNVDNDPSKIALQDAWYRFGVVNSYTGKYNVCEKEGPDKAFTINHRCPMTKEATFCEPFPEQNNFMGGTYIFGARADEAGNITVQINDNDHSDNSDRQEDPFAVDIFVLP